MKMKKIFISIALAIVIIGIIGYCCADSIYMGTKSGKEILLNKPQSLLIDIDQAQSEDMILYSSFLEAPDVIVLETKNECIIQNIYALDVYNDKIYILDDKAYSLFVFNRDGSFLHKIGRRGNGPGEYIELSDFSIDRARGIIYLWDEAADKAYKYDAETGKFISSVQTEQDGDRSFCIQYCNDKLYINRSSEEEEPGSCLLREIDEKTGKQLASFISAEEYNRGWNYALRLPYSFFYSKNTDHPKYIGIFSDKIFTITKDIVIPAYTIKSKDFVKPSDVEKVIRKYKSNGHSFDLSDLYKDDKVFMISGFVEMDNFISFQYMKGYDRYYLLHNKQTKETTVSLVFADDYISEKNNIPTDFCYSDKEGVVSVMKTELIPYFIENIISKGLLNPHIDKHDELMNMDETSNPVLFFHKYKKSKK